MKHLLNTTSLTQSKFSKCLTMTYEVIKEKFDFLTTEGGNILFNSFDAIMRCDHKFIVKEDRETIEKLYIFLIELNENEEGLFTE